MFSSWSIFLSLRRGHFYFGEKGHFYFGLTPYVSRLTYPGFLPTISASDWYRNASASVGESMATWTLSVNGVNHTVDADPNMPLLWVLRDLLNLTGTKFGYGIGMCTACIVLMDGEAVRSCLTPVSESIDHVITTIEGLSVDGQHAVQQAWLAEAVPQC